MHRVNRPIHADAILLLVATVGLIYLIHATIAANTVGTVLGWASGRTQLPDAQTDRVIDDLARSALPPAGNAVIDLPALARQPGVEPDAVLRFYARATYTLWPRRLYVAEPGAAVVWGRDLAATTQPTDPRWLADHDVRAAATIRLRPAMSVQRRDIRPGVIPE
jgi:hypothetical protein